MMTDNTMYKYNLEWPPAMMDVTNGAGIVQMKRAIYEWEIYTLVLIYIVRAIE